jgi:glycosyltransferase involved in cell wall biosynthesis
MRRIIERSEAVVAMTELSRQTLIDVYGCPPEKAVVVYHGVPDFSFNQIERYQRKLRIKNAKPMLLAAGLLGPGKGLEYIIDAMPAIVKALPQAKLFIVGQTHPVILRTEGESYREKLMQLVRKNKVTRHVRFVNKYLDNADLRNYYQAADFFITAYPNIQQSASGTLAWALGAGKICISTPYQYAKEVLGDGTGILIERRSITAIATSVIDTFKDPAAAKAIRKLAYAKGRLRTWPNVALSYLELFRLVIEQAQAMRYTTNKKEGMREETDKNLAIGSRRLA